MPEKSEETVVRRKLASDTIGALIGGDMASRKLTITIPEELAEDLDLWRNRLNISAVCAEAIQAELRFVKTRLLNMTREESWRELCGDS